jgi:thiamine biosynthesis lipoprotein
MERFRSMGCEVLVGGASPQALSRIKRLFETRDSHFSRFVRDSELNRVNSAETDVVVLSPGFHRMMLLALRGAALTDGLVDPTLGRAVEEAGYDRDFAELGPQEAPAGSGERGRWRELRFSRRCLRRPSGIRLDLNGVVKGRTVDDALTLIEGPGFVSAGGDLATRTPLDVALPGGEAVSVRGGLATSSRARRRWLRAGEWQHHLIDPATGRPSMSPWTDVSVCASTCLDADIAAKAAFLLGRDGPDWLDDRGLAGRFLLPSGESVSTRGWRAGASEPAAA